MRGFTTNRSPQRGYLLLEVVIAMGLAAVLLGGIFTIATGTMSLAEKVVTEGRMQTRREAFLDFLGQSFEQLPGNAVIELQTTETAQRFLPRLTIENAPASFSFAGQPFSAQAIVLTTVPVPSGGVNVVIEYYEEPLLDSGDLAADTGQEPVGSLILYRDIWRFELRVLDVRTDEWVSDWDIPSRLPLQVELNAVFDPDGEEVVHYFWIPPKANPASLMQALTQGRGTSTSQGGTNQGGTTNATPAVPGGTATPADPTRVGRGATTR